MSRSAPVRRAYRRRRSARRLRAGREPQRALRRKLELAGTGLVSGQLPDHRSAANLSLLLRRRLSRRVSDRFGHDRDLMGGRDQPLRTSARYLHARHRRTAAVQWLGRQSPRRSALPRPDALLRVLPRRQRRGHRRFASNRLDRHRRQIDSAVERVRGRRKVAARVGVRSQTVTSETRRVAAIVAGADGDPFSFLGMHATANGTIVRAFRPGADRLYVVSARTDDIALELERVHPAGMFARELARTEPFPYKLRETAGGADVEFEDPYRFGPLLGPTDAWLIAEGNHLKLWEVLGAHPRELDGGRGVSFAVWAPNARRVSVVGDFNGWDGRVNPMRFRSECGVWEIFVPGELTGQSYRYELIGPSGGRLPLRSDPLAFACELRPANASIVAAPSAHLWRDEAWMQRRAATIARDRPVSIY